MLLQSLKSKVASGFVQVSALVLIAASFITVIGSPYSVEFREAGEWLGGVLVAGLGVYTIYQTVIRFNFICSQVLAKLHRLAKVPANLAHAASASWLQITTHETGKAHNLRLPPDIFFAKELVE